MFQHKNTLWKPTWARRYDEGNSPLHLWTTQTQELRSQLFPERQRIPSRKGKYIITAGLLMQMWGLYHVSLIRKQFQQIQYVKYIRHKKMDNQKMERKAAPFLQAMADIRYCAITEKKDMLMRELFSADHYDRIKDRFIQKDIWVPYRSRYPHMYNKTTKNPRPFLEQHSSRYLHGYDVFNI